MLRLEENNKARLGQDRKGQCTRWTEMICLP